MNITERFSGLTVDQKELSRQEKLKSIKKALSSIEPYGNKVVYTAFSKNGQIDDLDMAHSVFEELRAIGIDPYTGGDYRVDSRMGNLDVAKFVYTNNVNTSINLIMETAYRNEDWMYTKIIAQGKKAALPQQARNNIFAKRDPNLPTAEERLGFL